MKLANYALDQSIEDCSGLREASPLECLVLRKRYDGERIFKAPDTTIDGRTWAVFLATLSNGKIYKIAAQFMSGEEGSVDAAFSEAYSFYKNQFGTPDKTTESGAHMWEQPFGNFILGKGGVPGARVVNCVATSASSLSAKPRKGAAQRNTLALQALIFGLMGLFAFLPAFGAVVCGHIALARFKKDPAVGGRKLAIAGLVLGYAVTSLVVIYLLLLALGFRH